MKVGFRLDRRCAKSLSEQIAEHYRTEILSGRLGEGTILPTRKTLVAELGVSKNVVQSAVAKLTAEGLVRARPRIGCEIIRTDVGEGREAALVAAYDDTGVHVYARFRDSNAKGFKYGESAGVGLEFSVMPGEDTSYWQTFFSSGAVIDKQEVEWNGPGFGEPLRAAALTADTATHAETAATIRRALVRRAAGDYLRFRAPWANTDIWGDPHLGDRAFFEAVVKPWTEAEDEAAKRAIRETGLSDTEISKIAAEHLRAWLDPRLTLDAKRAAWLETEFFGKGDGK